MAETFKIGDVAKVTLPEGISFPAEIIEVKADGTLVAKTAVADDPGGCIWHLNPPNAKGISTPVG